jgi:hypothetical protein
MYILEMSEAEEAYTLAKDSRDSTGALQICRLSIVLKLYINFGVIYILWTQFIQMPDIFALIQVIEFNDINMLVPPSWGSLGFLYVYSLAIKSLVE